MKFRFQCPQIKLYWNTAMLIHLRIIYGCFCDPDQLSAELNSYDGDIMAHGA